MENQTAPVHAVTCRRGFGQTETVSSRALTVGGFSDKRDL